LDKDGSSAVIEHMQTGQQINAYFTNIQLFNFDPSTARLPNNFDDQIDELFPDKYSLAYYHPQSIQRCRVLNERKIALERQREFDEVIDNLENLRLAQRFSQNRRAHQNSQNSQASELNDSFHLEQLFDQNDQVEPQNGPDLIAFDHPHTDPIFDTPDTAFESTELDSFNDRNLEELAHLQQPELSPSKLSVKMSQQSNLQQSNLERESTFSNNMFDRNLDFDTNPPLSQQNSQDAQLTDANPQQPDFPQTDETSSDTDDNIDAIDNLENSQVSDPEIEPIPLEVDQQRDNDQPPAIDPIPEPSTSHYSLRDQNRVNPYTFLVRMSKKWVDNR
jgi:hypothetical protein